MSTSAYYYEAVKWAQEKGITGGIGNGLFGPNQPCTRAQIVTFLWRAAGSSEPKSMSSFSDVSADSYYAKAVAWAVENGITTGTGDGKFSPDATCTREQAVAFLYRASGSPAVSGGSAFSDVAANAYYADAVAWAEKNGVTGGIGGGCSAPGIPAPERRLSHSCTVPIRVSKANRQSNIKLPLRIILGGSFLLCTAGNWRGTLLQCEYLTYILKAIMLLLSKAA